MQGLTLAAIIDADKHTVDGRTNGHKKNSEACKLYQGVHQVKVRT